MVKETRLNDYPYQKQACEIYNCRNYAAYSIHRHDFKEGARLNLCEECVTSMLNDLPSELENKVGEDMQMARNTSKAQEQANELKQEQENPALHDEVNTMSMPLDEHKPVEYGPQQNTNEQPLPEEQKPKGDTNESDQEQDTVSTQHMKSHIVDVLSKSTVEELKEHAKDLGIPYYYEMKKDELVEAIADKEIEHDKS